MTIEQAFKHLIKNWKNQEPDFKNKYRSYKSKFLKNKKDPNSEGIGKWKMVEMLECSGYIEIKIIKAL